MRRALPFVALVLTGALIGALLAGLSRTLAFIVAMAIVYLLLPAVGIIQARMIARVDEFPSRTQLYAGSMAMLWPLALLVTGLALAGGMSRQALAFVGVNGGVALAWMAGLTVGGIALVAFFRAASVRDSALTAYLMPRTRRERRLFALLSVTAGVTEEVLYRGVAIGVVVALGGGVPLAVVVSSVAFGALHMYQGWVGALRSGLLGLLLALPVIVTGSLVPAIGAHALLDLVLGLVLGPRWISDVEGGNLPQAGA
jgi:uncharacterized protein